MKRAAAILISTMVLVGAGCSSGGSDAEGGGGASTTAPKATTTTTSEVPQPLDDQTPPTSINGLTVQGSTLWVASIKDDALLQVDPETGAILRRVDTEGAGPDDVAVGPDGSIWSTGFVNGDLGRTTDGTYEVVTNIAPGINPLEFDDDGNLFVGTYGPKGTLYQVPTDQPSGEDVFKQVVATDLPDINAFGITPDGLIVAPSGGVAGPGAAVGITVVPAGDSQVETLAKDLPPVAAGATDADGVPYVLANITGEVIQIDPEAKTSKVVRTVKEGAPFDNLAFAPDGTLYLSSFVGPTITVVAPDGATKVLTIGAG